MSDKRYNTGKPCKYGHLADRLKSNRQCVECSKAKLLIWQKNNPDKVKKLDRARHQRDREKRNAKQREYAKNNVELATKRKSKWAQENREKALQIQKKWNERNRHKINAYAANRRCLTRGAGKHTGDDIKKIYAQQGGLCKTCGAVLGKWHVDHIVPISAGGSNEAYNLQLLCKSCNLRKSNKSLEEFLEILRGLHGSTKGV